MPMDKDYTLALNRGLFNTFDGKYVRAAFDQIKEDIRDAETIPETLGELAQFSKKIVEDAFNEDFKMKLIKQVVRSILTAPPLNTKINSWEAALKCIAKAYGWNNMIKIWADTRGFSVSGFDKVMAKYQKTGSVSESELVVSFKSLRDANGHEEEFLKYIETMIKGQQ